MLNELSLEPDKTKPLNDVTLDINSFQKIFDRHLNSSNSLEDEIVEFVREVAALKCQGVDDTISEMMAGTKKYLEAVNQTIEFKNNIPTDINKYVKKIELLSEGIEACWDLFSIESKQFFVGLSQDFCRNYEILQGLSSLSIRVQLLFPSLQQKENLFKKYKDSLLLIPKAVNRATELRQSKSTSQLQATAQSILERVKGISTQHDLLPFLKHLGNNQEEQLKKNQAAMDWAKARLEEIKSRRNGRGL